ncbi:hypothetical protein [Legionella sp. W05-934-2]|jgi:hypothetical protein|uniref:hypothetical protein n=1 Tax=Legionella sp. W05-934-2 TaxID=1198649 RepID=UPI0034624972
MRPHLFCALLLTVISAYSQPILKPWITIDAQGTREITPFEIDGQRYLAVAQLAKDIPHTPANMNGGNSDVDVIILREGKGLFTPLQSIPSHGNEGVEFFSINNIPYIAVASIRSGPHAPYNINTYSKLYQWDGKRFYPIQQFFNLATKQWRHFQIGERHFLAQANGIIKSLSESSLSTNSMIYEWDGHSFQPFQTIASTWAYSWEFFEMDGQYYLALADHVNHSMIYQWNGRSFQTFQNFPGSGGRVFKYMKIGDKSLLAFANINHNSMIYQFKQGKWEPLQTLNGTGGRNFTYFKYKGDDYLLRINFITGSREKPVSVLKSPLYRWNGNQFEQVEEITTYGGVSANPFMHGGQLMIAVANSLSKDLRFKQPSLIYQVGEAQRPN